MTSKRLTENVWQITGKCHPSTYPSGDKAPQKWFVQNYQTGEVLKAQLDLDADRIDPVVGEFWVACGSIKTTHTRIITLAYNFYKQEAGDNVSFVPSLNLETYHSLSDGSLFKFKGVEAIKSKGIYIKLNPSYYLEIGDNSNKRRTSKGVATSEVIKLVSVEDYELQKEILESEDVKAEVVFSQDGKMNSKVLEDIDF